MYFENSPFSETYMENSSENFLTDFFWQNNDQYRHFIATVDSKLKSLPWMRWKSQADIAGVQPISLTIFISLIKGRTGCEGQQSPHDHINLKYTVIFLASLVHTDFWLAGITSTPHSLTLSRYLAWFGDFNSSHHLSMPHHYGQYFSMPRWST